MNIILQASGSGMALPGILLISVVGFCLYFLPAIIGRNHSSSGGILMLNLFLGWTFIGWVGALVWACSASTQPVIITNNAAPSSPPTINIDILEKLAAMRASGVLTEDEFQAEKKKLLT
jgi:hypothetical protein